MPLPKEILDLAGMPEEIPIKGLPKPIIAYKPTGEEWIEFENIATQEFERDQDGRPKLSEKYISDGRKTKGSMYLLFILLQKNFREQMKGDTFEEFLKNDWSLLVKFQDALNASIRDAKDIMEKKNSASDSSQVPG